MLSVPARVGEKRGFEKHEKVKTGLFSSKPRRKAAGTIPSSWQQELREEQLCVVSGETGFWVLRFPGLEKPSCLMGGKDLHGFKDQ